MAASVALASAEDLDQIAGVDFCAFAAFAGLQCNEYEVMTKDGYILTVHNIPCQLGVTCDHSAKNPVFLQHGVPSESDVFIVQGQNSIVAALLGAGFDVWLGNNRGNKYSRGHRKYDWQEDDKKYWDFTYEEMGKYDVPAMVDKVLDVTGKDQVQYVGFSNGSTQAFYGMANRSSKEWYEKHVSHALMLSPCTKLSGTQREPLPMLAGIQGIFLQVLNYYGWHHLGGEDWSSQPDVINACTVFPPLYELTATIYGNADSAYGAKLLSHYAQGYTVDRFQEYNKKYAKDFELQPYEKQKTKHVKLEDIMIPISMYVAQQDDLCTEENAEWARDQLGNVVRYETRTGGHTRWVAPVPQTDWIVDALYDLTIWDTGSAL